MIAGEVRSLRLQTLILGIDRCNLLGTVGAGELVRIPRLMTQIALIGLSCLRRGSKIAKETKSSQSTRSCRGSNQHRNSVSSPEHQGENEVARIEQKDLEEHRDEIIADVKKMVEKYRAIFDWNVPDIDQTVADKLILGEVRKALDEIEKKLLG